MKYYTLRNSANEDMADLNGKMFSITKDSTDNTLTFFDLLNDEYLRETSPLVEQVETSDGIIYVCESGVKYDMIDISTLLPTKPNDKKKPKARDGILFDDEYRDTLDRLADVTEIVEFLDKYTEEPYIVNEYKKRFKGYIDELEELKEDLNWEYYYDPFGFKIDGETCVLKFDKIFKESLFEYIMEPLYRVREREKDKFSTDLLDLINLYLAKIGIYTKNLSDKTSSGIYYPVFFAKYNSEGIIQEIVL